MKYCLILFFVSFIIPLTSFAGGRKITCKGKIFYFETAAKGPFPYGDTITVQSLGKSISAVTTK